MAITKDPITGQTGDIGNQNEAAFQQDVWGAQKRAERMANKTQTTQSNIVNRVPVAPTAITPSDLQPQAPVTVPTVPTPTTTSSVAGSTQSLIERMVANRELEATKAAKQSEDDYKATFDQITGVQESVGKVQDELKVNEKEATKDKLLADLEMSQRAQLNAIRELEKNPRGLFGGALEQEKQRINREFAYEQADKALLYEVANRDFARASEQADRKIALQLEPLKMKLDFQSKFYEVNQDNLSKSQQNTLQALIAKNEREYESEQSRLKTLEDTRLKVLFEAQTNGADPVTLSAIQRAETPEEAIIAGGSFIGAQQRFENELKLAGFNSDQEYRNYQIENLKSEILKRNIEVAQAMDSGVVNDNPGVASYYDALANASLGLPENQRKENTQRLNNLLKNGETKSAQDLIIRTVFANQTGTQRDDTIKRQQAITSLTDIKNALAEVEKAGISTNLLSGNFQDISQKLGKSGNPQLAAIGTRITQALQVYRNAITGAAWGEQETNEYKTLFPSYKNESKLNNTIIDSMINALNSNQKVMLESYIGSGAYRDVFTPKFNKLDDLIKFDPSYRSELEALLQTEPDLTEEDALRALQPAFNTVGGDTNQASTIKDGSRVQTGLWRGIATGIESGSKFWKYGLDIALDGGKQAKVTSPFSGEVISAKNDGAWGNSVKVKLNDGRIVRLSHLDNINVKPGQKITTGTYIGNQGNTGKTYGKTGVHLDVTIYKPDGKPYTSREVAAILGTKLA